MRDKVTRQCPQTATFEEKGEPKQIRTDVLLLTVLTVRPNRLTYLLLGPGATYLTVVGLVVQATDSGVFLLTLQASDVIAVRDVIAFSNDVKMGRAQGVGAGLS